MASRQQQVAGEPYSVPTPPAGVENSNGSKHHRWRCWRSDADPPPVVQPTSAADVEVQDYVARATGPHAVPIKENTCGCGTLTAGEMVGPLLRYQTFDVNEGRWTGSVLVVCKSLKQPVLLIAAQGRESTVDGEQLDKYKDWTFWRFPIAITTTDQEQRVSYRVLVEGMSELSQQAASFVVPGRDQPWHWCFYSCSGFSNDVPIEEQCRKWRGLDPLWLDVIERHKQQPLHLTVGGGDQLYNDDVFQLPSMQAWARNGLQEKLEAPFTSDMAEEVEAYYFHHYCTHFSYGPIAWAYANIPYSMTWDDHDLFDGWGSYPHDLQQCGVFQGMFIAMSRFYLLFQQHTTAELASSHGLIGGQGWSSCVQLGPRVALVMMDQRAERSRKQVISLGTYLEVLGSMQRLPASVQHVVVVTTVPVVYPHFLGAVHVLGCLRDMTRTSGLNWVLKGTGIRRMLLNRFEEPELMDDIQDHWNSYTHVDERRFLVEHLQMVAQAKNVRISLISGDVHLAASGRLYTWPKMRSLRHDYRYMPQIVSSAISNPPPVDAMVRALRFLGRAGYTNHHTKNKMVKTFRDHRLHDRILNMRNWCEVHEVVSSHPEAQDQGALVFSYRVEDTIRPPVGGLRPGNLKTYDTLVPVLEAAPGASKQWDFRRVYRR